MGGDVRRFMAWINVYVGPAAPGAKMGMPVPMQESQVDALKYCEALIDTGATNTTIKDSHAVAMGLRLLSFADVSTPNGKAQFPVYAMTIVVPGRDKGTLVSHVIPVIGVARDMVCDMLYGMDMLSDGRFVMDLDAHGNGNWEWHSSAPPGPPPAAPASPALPASPPSAPPDPTA